MRTAQGGSQGVGGTAHAEAAAGPGELTWGARAGVPQGPAVRVPAAQQRRGHRLQARGQVPRRHPRALPRRRRPGGEGGAHVQPQMRPGGGGRTRCASPASASQRRQAHEGDPRGRAQGGAHLRPILTRERPSARVGFGRRSPGHGSPRAPPPGPPRAAAPRGAGACWFVVLKRQRSNHRGFLGS